MRALLLLLALAAPAAAEDRCLLACDEVTTGLDAAQRLTRHLGAALPKGATVVGLVEGGFQDAFLQARIDVAEPDLARLLDILGGDLDWLVPAEAEGFGPPGPAWWDVAAREGLLVSRGDLDDFAWTRLGVARAEGAASLYLWAFQT